MERTRIPSLNWLRVFEAAARTESFARAAVELSMSAPAVSQQVKALEAHLGAELFTRHAHAVRLTEAGRAYLPSVQMSLVSLETSTAGLFGRGREERLYVQAVHIFAQGVLAPLYSDFTTRHPGIKLVLTTGNAVGDFTHAFSDLKIIFGAPSAFGPAHDRLIGETLYPVARPEIAASIRTPADLLSHPLLEVATHRAGWPHVFESLRILGAGARFLMVDSTVMAAALAGQGAGVALARAPASDPIMAAQGLVPCLPGVGVMGLEYYHLVYPDPGTLRRPARAFRAWLMERMRTFDGPGAQV
ncbi:LysR family transcriptional regulator [Defluviimonas sp. WL0002]|uniref:LysR family transcriptional regulator n=1 Tax=Albidovulum marisflavi TaxID=2984159 RepID=A0ABT2ZBU1_9RHOB|nr:LysR family transcriptional regulator [Defluviimonas sp. WL0002]MCV2868246.1 LysR family transcriptional regulator [Defluviimonas sp. WL0002]